MLHHTSSLTTFEARRGPLVPRRCSTVPSSASKPAAAPRPRRRPTRIAYSERPATTTSTSDAAAALLGGASSSGDGWDSSGAAPWADGAPLSPHLLPGVGEKCIVVLRHGASTWNEEGRIQGTTDESQLTEAGRQQALRARDALSDIPFDSCFSSPHKRARQTAELVWGDPVYLDSLRECDLGWFQGLRNDDIARTHPELYRVWREEPENFCLDGRFPVRDAFDQARRAWADLLRHEGHVHLVVTHKSILRAMLCTAMGLPPSRFRSIDISNGAVVMLRAHPRGVNLAALNLTAHLQLGGVRYRLPKTSRNDGLVP